MSDQHNITISGNTVSTGLLSLSESSVECVKCDESCDVPSLVRESSPFVHVLYKLFAETVINNGNIAPSSSSVSDVAQYMYKHSTQSQ